LNSASKVEKEVEKSIAVQEGYFEGDSIQ
jgi:hypothetical protein